jgi:hypothetical protein
MSRPIKRPVFAVTLRPLPYVSDPIHALRRALKALRRTCGLQCLAVEEVEDSQSENRKCLEPQEKSLPPRSNKPNAT